MGTITPPKPPARRSRTKRPETHGGLPATPRFSSEGDAAVTPRAKERERPGWEITRFAERLPPPAYGRPH
jgi:hypothetical protein